jgi:hypothetical protein
MMVTDVRGHFKNVRGTLDRGGVIVGDDVAVTIDAEAILQP